MTDTQFSSDSDMVGGSARSPAAFRSARHSISFLVCQLPLASSLLFDVSIWCHGSLLHIVLYRSLHAGFELATQCLLCSRLCYKFMSIHRSINCLVCQLPLASSLLFEVRIWCHGSLLHIVLYRSLHAGLELALEYLLCSRLCYKFGLSITILWTYLFTFSLL